MHVFRGWVGCLFLSEGSSLFLPFSSLVAVFYGLFTDSQSTREKEREHPSAEMCRGFFVVFFFGQDFAGDFPGGFFWALFPTKMRKNIRRQSPRKNAAARIQNPRKIRLCQKPTLIFSWERERGKEPPKKKKTHINKIFTGFSGDFVYVLFFSIIKNHPPPPNKHKQYFATHPVLGQSRKFVCSCLCVFFP